MKRLGPKLGKTSKEAPRSKSARRAATEKNPETEGLMRALDKVYDRLRKRARAEWLRNHPGEDPSDACVSVRIDPESGKSLRLSDKIR
jgi:hypothetical protein